MDDYSTEISITITDNGGCNHEYDLILGEQA